MSLSSEEKGGNQIIREEWEGTIGRVFIEAFRDYRDDLERRLGIRPKFLVQGTLYPDVIEGCPPPGSDQKHTTPSRATTTSSADRKAAESEATGGISDRGSSMGSGGRLQPAARTAGHARPALRGAPGRAPARCVPSPAPHPPGARGGAARAELAPRPLPPWARPGGEGGGRRRGTGRRLAPPRAALPPQRPPPLPALPVAPAASPRRPRPVGRTEGAEGAEG